MKYRLLRAIGDRFWTFFPQKSDFEPKWEGTLIQVEFFNFLRHYRLFSNFFQFYSERIDFPKSNGISYIWTFRCIMRLFLDLFAPKSQISDKSLLIYIKSGLLSAKSDHFWTFFPNTVTFWTVWKNWLFWNYLGTLGRDLASSGHFDLFTELQTI